MRRLTTILLLLAACTEKESTGIGAGAERDDCNRVSDCQAGLTCTNNACVPIEGLADSKRGVACTSDAECAPDLVCGTQGVCTDVAGKGPGEACGLLEDCQPPLVCSGVSGLCEDPTGSPAGTFGLGDACVEITDCQRPYLCVRDFGELAAAGECQPLPPLFLGADCSRSDEEAGAFRVHFELEPGEFYRQPFPSDLRRSPSGVDVAAHPSPGAVFGFDVVGSFKDVIANDVDGFALNAPIFFQLTDLPTNGSLCLDAGGVYPELPPDDGDPETPEPEPFCTGGAAASVYLVNIDDPSSPAYGERIPVELAVSRERGQFICQNWLGIAPRPGRPLAPGTTYAAVITTALRDMRGDAPIKDRDFALLLRGEGPADAALAMQPLRDWIAGGGAAEAEIAAATVFTTGTPSAIGEALRAAVHAAAAPAFNGDEAACPVALPSDCEGSGLVAERQCGASSASFLEVHGSYDGPVFQEGTRPYLTPAMGGAIRMTNGAPQIVRQEKMCFALAVPNAPMPPRGWPTVIYAHGTGGNYRSFVDDSLLMRFIAAGYAVIGIDNVMHGPRMDPSSDPALWAPPLWSLKDPGELFFNLVNPRASRDNVLQGAADLFHLVRLLRSTGPISNGDIDFDPARIVFFGHSQGTVVAPAFLAYETDVQAVILSGAGAELPLSILNKTEPADVSVAAGLFFGDRNLGRIHPMMGLMALVFGPADAVSFADLVLTNPPAGRTPVPLLMFSGVGDLNTPDVTQHALMRALDIPIVGATAAPVEEVAIIASPAQNNLRGLTAGAVHYSPPAGENGHFVLYDLPEAGATLQSFLESVPLGGRIVR